MAICFMSYEECLQFLQEEKSKINEKYSSFGSLLQWLEQEITKLAILDPLVENEKESHQIFPRLSQ